MKSKKKNKKDKDSILYNALIIENDENRKADVSDILIIKRFHVYYACNYDEAVKILGKRKYDLVIFDVFLPNEIDCTKAQLLIHIIYKYNISACIFIITDCKDENTLRNFENGIYELFPKKNFTDFENVEYFIYKIEEAMLIGEIPYLKKNRKSEFINSEPINTSLKFDMDFFYTAIFFTFLLSLTGIGVSLISIFFEKSEFFLICIFTLLLFITLLSFVFIKKYPEKQELYVSIINNIISKIPGLNKLIKSIFSNIKI